MFLKTVPPVVAVHSKWRSSKSLPLFFNDSASDSDLASASGTPIPQKIQMIIESLHSTQSSDMSDNLQSEKAANSSREAGYASARTRRTATDAKRQNTGSDAGEDSDSDDSVDRGIEEAIQEYLKEKVDHKRKGDPVMSPSPAPKLQRRDPSAPDAAKQHTHSNSSKVLTASNHIQKTLTETQPLKKKVKKKKPSKENPFKRADTWKALPVRSPLLPRSKKGSSSSSEMDRSPPRLVIKEEECLDSSSDDGIEEEIQRFQQEKKDKQKGGRSTTRSSHHLDSDSSSDEGIEEAIRRFQEEKHKQKPKKSPLKPSQLVSVQRSKPAVVPTERTSTQPLRTLSKKNSKKKPTSKKSALPAPLAVSNFINKRSPQKSKVKGFSASPTHPQQPHTEHQVHPSLKVNTAELMCAEAILDISKTVMPEIFESNLNFCNQNLFQTSSFPVVTPSDDKSSDSSVDSEDGIEQEIRKFLELKAQMNKETLICSGDLAAGKEVKTKETLSNTATRLSLSRKRKFKEEQSNPSTDGDINADGEPPEKSPVYDESTTSQMPELSAPPTAISHSSPSNKSKPNSPLHKLSDGATYKDDASSCIMSSPPDAPRSVIGSEKNDSSDKSSSLDSDEDLDAAIKDLLKTKKKVKKKVRDLKARKGCKPSETPTLDSPITEQKSLPPTKMVRPNVLKSETLNVQAESNKSPRSKAVKTRADDRGLTNTDRMAGNDGALRNHDHEGGSPSSVPHAKDEDSSVDSDDSIEQEIRRFLAERAKVTPATTSIKKEEVDVKALGTSTQCDVKSDHQQNPTHIQPAPIIPLSNIIRSVCASPTENPADSTDDLLTSATSGSRTEEMKDRKDRHLSDTPHSSPVSLHLHQPSPEPQPYPGSDSIAPAPQDQTAFPSPSAQETNHLQVRQTELSESRESLEEEQRVGDDRKKEQDRQLEEEKCVDETDVESDEDRVRSQKMKAQHHPSHRIFSTCIDPGVLLSPYIALNTEERRLKFQNRRLQIQKQLQVSTTVKRRLQFVVSVPRFLSYPLCSHPTVTSTDDVASLSEWLYGVI